ncbi:hypothetical protein M3T53_00985 [Actinomyces sp. B33]|uniref:hypothetical protein n=1 Tax=Actinomyces sp. B33 TaxID=2942131 RepID=UPI0023403618|nr:hypothetical protein [Actinomyces sp. B33]MDC4232292.1 hypothetical protein [Actinomyces sp. B33]
MTMTRLAASALAAACAALLAGCTASVAPTAPADPFAAPLVPGGESPEAPEDAQSAHPGLLGAPAARTGRGIVVVAVVEGSRLPSRVRAAFTEDTGFDLRIVEVASAPEAQGSGAQVVVGLDAAEALGAGGALAGAPQDATAPEGTALVGAPGAIAYGRDDVCVLADRSWMSANALAMPDSADALSRPPYASLLAVPDPRATSTGRAFVEAVAASTGEALGEWARGLGASAVIAPSVDAALAQWTAADLLVDDEDESSEDGGDAQSDAPGDLPLVVAPRSTAARALNNTGTESAAVPVPSTCLARTVYAAGVADDDRESLSDGAESLIAWLLGWRGQRALAEAGAVYPLDESALGDTAADWFLAPSGAEAPSDEATAAAAGQRVVMWEEGLTAPPPAEEEPQS